VPAHLVRAFRELSPEVPDGRLRIRPYAHHRDEDDAEQEARCVDREHPRSARDRDDHSRHGWAEDVRAAAGERDQRVRLLQGPRADGLGDERSLGGIEEPGGRPSGSLQHGELPDVRGPAEEQHRGRALRSQPDEVGRDHHCAPWQSVRPHAAGEGGSGNCLTRSHSP